MRFFAVLKPQKPHPKAQLISHAVLICGFETANALACGFDLRFRNHNWLACGSETANFWPFFLMRF